MPIVPELIEKRAWSVITHLRMTPFILTHPPVALLNRFNKKNDPLFSSHFKVNCVIDARKNAKH